MGQSAGGDSPRVLPTGFLGGPSKALWAGLGRYSPRAACFLKRFWLRSRDQEAIVHAAVSPSSGGGGKGGGYCAAACSYVAADPSRWARFADECSNTPLGGDSSGHLGSVRGAWATLSRILLALGSLLGALSFCTTNKVAERKCKQVGGYLLVFAWFTFRRVRRWWAHGEPPKP